MTDLLNRVIKDSKIHKMENKLTENLFARACSDILYSMLTQPQEDSYLYEKFKRSNYVLPKDTQYLCVFMEMFIEESQEKTVVCNLSIPLLDILQLICISDGIYRDPKTLYKDIRVSLSRNMSFQ